MVEAAPRKGAGAEAGSLAMRRAASVFAAAGRRECHDRAGQQVALVERDSAELVHDLGDVHAKSQKAQSEGEGPWLGHDSRTRNRHL